MINFLVGRKLDIKSQPPIYMAYVIQTFPELLGLCTFYIQIRNCSKFLRGCSTSCSTIFPLLELPELLLQPLRKYLWLICRTVQLTRIISRRLKFVCSGADSPPFAGIYLTEMLAFHTPSTRPLWYHAVYNPHLITIKLGSLNAIRFHWKAANNKHRAQEVDSTIN